jgi:ketosteroid isomerase-like protein
MTEGTASFAEAERVAREANEALDSGDLKAFEALLAEDTVVRRDPETRRVEMRACPAIVARVRDGKIVFLEGYRDRRKAFSDLGLEPSE